MMHTAYTVYDLRVNEQQQPLGLDDVQLNFSWKQAIRRRGAQQTHYRVWVATSEQLLGDGQADVWDSGKRAGCPLRVPYEGPELGQGERYWWKLESWAAPGVADLDGVVDSGEPVTAVASFDTGLRQDGWQATWIWKPGARVMNDFAYFRKSFEQPKPIFRAMLYISAHNRCQIYVNGTRVGGHGTPAPTDPQQRKYYLAYDVTSLLTQGSNCLAAIVHYLGGSGQNYVNGLPGLLAQLELRYEDSTSGLIVSDATWEVLNTIPHAVDMPFQQFRHLSAIEHYDARNVAEDWMQADYAAGDTSPAVIVDELQARPWRLRWQPIPEGIESAVLVPEPVGVQEAGCQVFDAGLIVSGWARIQLPGIAGTAVRMRYSEALDEEGFVKHFIANEQSEYYYDDYMMRGAGLETWAPEFSYKAFRYVEITGYPHVIDASQIAIVSAHTGIRHEGAFHSSDELLNRIYEACIQTQKNNTLGLLADCPHREQAQFLADADLQGETLLYHFGEAYPVLEKVLSDFADAQLDNGTFPWVAPSGFDYPGFSGWIPEWDLHYCTLLWKLYEWSDQLQLLQRYYEPTKRMLHFYLQSIDPLTGLVPKSAEAGDWHISDHPYQNIDQSGSFLAVQNIKVKHALDLAGRMAAVLGDNLESDYWAEQSQRLQSAIVARLYDPVNKQFADSYLSARSHQGTNVVALQYDIVPPDDRADVLETIKQGGLDCRTLLALNLLRLLFDNGAEAEAFRLLHKTEYPGWGYMIAQGSRTIWEGFDDIESHSHAWNAYPARLLTEYLVGIRMAAPGWSRMVIKPYIPEGISFMKGAVPTPRGPAAARWEATPGQLVLEVTIPAHCEAEVVLSLPGEGENWQLEEAGRFVYGARIGPAPDIPPSMAIKAGADTLVVTLEGGNYSFLLRKGE